MRKTENGVPGHVTRRTILTGAASLAMLGAAGFSVPARGQVPGEGGRGPFDFEILSARMERLAAEPYRAPAPVLEGPFAGLDYDRYRLIQFRNAQARWAGAPHGFSVQAFHPGWLYATPVEVFAVEGGEADPLDFSSADFDYWDPDLAAAAAGAEFPGVAGLRLHYPLDPEAGVSELASFLGASYFRALGRGDIYGASARGLAVDTWTDRAEEFPRFTAFYLDPPEPGAPLVMHAALEGESITGAYRFTITPPSDDRAETVMEVTARLYFRKDIGELGIAPLTSMYLFGQTNRDDFDDYRPRVHDSEGLLVERDTGEVIWRPLSNTGTLGNSYLAEAGLRAFGLYQRARDFEDYQDAEARYERRPSIRIEPIGEWGPGTVRLVEIPARIEADDNIVAYWIPREPARAGQSMAFSYRLTWGGMDGTGRSGRVAETRAGRGGVSGVEDDTRLRKFVVDFAGGLLDEIAPETQIDLFNSAGGGRIESATLSYLAGEGIWRAVFDVEPRGFDPVELKAYLVGAGKVLTETWIYQWRPER
ncbi:glucan biosynthesis protein [Pelagibacterium montanilacus]|uniref:glucan biosynthesis protein n=1 Tax=Pelagibacterium montanilacus TaxID=2185280 RepID=UPI000F8C4E39|nr:glucan biosynthesis protein G [Pelagibacterium montanilacus]